MQYSTKLSDFTVYGIFITFYKKHGVKIVFLLSEKKTALTGNAIPYEIK